MSIPSRTAMRSSCLSLAVLAVLSSPLTAAAGDPPSDDADPQVTTLGKVEVRSVRATTTDETIDQARQRLAERAGGTGLVDGERYRDGRVSTLADALGYATGVFVQPRFGAEEARVSIRGSGIQRTFHGRGLELLQDGSPLNLADGGFDMQAVEPLATRYIEVYRGANALEYGAATLGGAINFVSPTGLTAPRAGVRMEAGSFGYRRAQATLAGAGHHADGYLSLSAFGQDGFRTHARQENYRVFANVGYRFGEVLDGRAYLTHVDTRSQLPGNLTLAQALATPERANPGNVALDQRRDFRLTRVAGRLAWSPAAGTLTMSAYYSDKFLDHPIFQVLNQDTQDYGIDLRWRSDGTLGGHRTLLVTGASLAQNDVRDDRFVNVAGQAGARTNQLDQRARNAKLFVEHQTWLDSRWVLAVGAQGLSSRRTSRDLLITGGRDESFDVAFTGISPKLGMRYLLDAESQLYANLSRSLEPPSFSEITGGPAATLVDEQRATTAELGLRIQRERLNVDASLYSARIDGELLALTDGNGNPLGTINAGRTVHRGVELGLDWRVADTLHWSLNALYNDFHFDGDAVFGNNQLAGVPRMQLRTQLRWQLGEHLYLTPNLEWTPQDYFIDHANTFRAPGYHVIGVRLGGDVGARWRWFVDARNLQDRKWIATTNVVANAGGRDAANFLPGDGRSVYAGFEWTWQ